jgi:hypothetical protein
MHIGWVPDPTGGYRGQMAVYVKPNGLLGNGYMAAIAPLRHLIVYPPMLRDMGRNWRARAGEPTPATTSARSPRGVEWDEHGGTLPSGEPTGPRVSHDPAGREADYCNCGYRQRHNGVHVCAARARRSWALVGFASPTRARSATSVAMSWRTEVVSV